MENQLSLRYLASHLLPVVGVVLIWRGIWNFLDLVDLAMFGGSHFWSSLVGIAVGVLILYLPDKDLEEIRQRPHHTASEHDAHHGVHHGEHHRS